MKNIPESLQFEKSSFSGADCIEVAFDAEEVFVRDSKDKQGPILRFRKSEWEAFVVGIRAGELSG